MAFAIYPSLIFTVAMLVTTAYFIMGGVPLLILKHDTPMDAWFVRGFFNIYYKAAFGTALGACLSYTLWGRFAFALGTATLAGVALLLRRSLLPAMQRLGAQIQAADDDAIRRFRKVHSAALCVNLLQLIVLVWGTAQLKV